MTTFGLKILYDFLLRNRRSGTTSTLKKISQESDVVVVVLSEKEKEGFNEKAVSFSDLENYVGHSLKPILFDNHILINFAETALDNANELERVMILNSKIQYHNSLIDSSVKEINILLKEIDKRH